MPCVAGDHAGDETSRGPDSSSAGTTGGTAKARAPCAAKRATVGSSGLPPPVGASASGVKPPIETSATSGTASGGGGSFSGAPAQPSPRTAASRQMASEREFLKRRRGPSEGFARGSSPCLKSASSALAILAFVCLAPVTAFASTKCLCNNGEITQSMDDDSDACDDACDMFGGGRTWTPADAADDQDVNVDTGRETVRDRADERGIERR